MSLQAIKHVHRQHCSIDSALPTAMELLAANVQGTKEIPTKMVQKAGHMGCI